MLESRPPRSCYYRLDGHVAVPCTDIIEWSLWYPMADKFVADSWIDEFRISTVFLGLDQNPFPEGDPLLFETMVIVDGEWECEKRYSLWEEAEIGHARLDSRIRQEMLQAELSAASAWNAVMLDLMRGN